MEPPQGQDPGPGRFWAPPRKPSTQLAFNKRTAGDCTHTRRRVDQSPFILPAESSGFPPTFTIDRPHPPNGIAEKQPGSKKRC